MSVSIDLNFFRTCEKHSRCKMSKRILFNFISSTLVPLQLIPHEIWKYLFFQLDIISVSSVSLICKQFYEILSSHLSESRAIFFPEGAKWVYEINGSKIEGNVGHSYVSNNLVSFNREEHMKFIYRPYFSNQDQFFSSIKEMTSLPQVC